MARFTNKVALVTGGASGIGAATAKLFAQNGASVVITDILEDQGEKTLHAIKEIGANTLFLNTDISDASAVKKMVDTTIDTFGRLDYAFNNAGIVGEQKPTDENTEEDWDKVLSINLKGTWLCMKYEIKQMLNQGNGVIVNNSSVAGLIGYRTISAYTASKHGILGLTKTAALEYAQKGIRINAVCPGVIRTPMVDKITKGDPDIEAQYVSMEPVGRMGTPEEVGQAVMWLCSDDASFVTGHPMVVDGGMVVQ
jgi:NAD(P)-dependent dehydrogenase (short-subunit alcohol dehydrogenase family)